jgi:3-phytase
MHARNCVAMVGAILWGVGCSSVQQLDTEQIDETRSYDVAEVRVQDRTRPLLGEFNDTAIWVDPSDTKTNRLLVANRELGHGGLYVLDFQGKITQVVGGQQLSYLDVRYQFPMGEHWVSVVAASIHSTHSLSFFQIVSGSGGVAEPIENNLGTLPFEPNVTCLYQSHRTGKFFVFVGDESGTLHQFEMQSVSTSELSLTEVRNFHLPSPVSACVVDDLLGHVYLAENTNGIWKYNAEPTTVRDPVLIDTMQPEGNLPLAGISGLALYQSYAAEGYLIASTTGEPLYHVYQRGSENSWITNFRIQHNLDEAVVQDYRLSITNLPINDSFPHGLMVTHQTFPDGGVEAFELVSWKDVREITYPPLMMDTKHTPWW